MDDQSIVERIKAFGTAEAGTTPAETVRDVYRVVNTLLQRGGGEYCWCQTVPCECIGHFMDDLAECLSVRYPELHNSEGRAS